ncbi:MAG: hypothetical protein QM733_05505 [Ilumatobacteraceae bacterium]
MRAGVAALIGAALMTAAGCSHDAGGKGSDTVVTVGSVVPADPRVVELAVASGNGNPADAAIPPPATADATRWLRGEGHAAAAIVPASEPLWQEGASSCPAVAAALDGIGSPGVVVAAAADVPDAATGEVLVSLHGMIGSLLGTCADPAAYEQALPAFAWQWQLANRRLQELGVR